IDDLIVSDEEDEPNIGSRPGSSDQMLPVGRGPIQSLEQDELPESVVEEERMSPGGKETGNAYEFDERTPLQIEPYANPKTFNGQSSPDLPPRSPLRKTINSSPLPSPAASTRLQRNLPASPLRNIPPISYHQDVLEDIMERDTQLGPPIHSPHRKTPSTD